MTESTYDGIVCTACQGRTRTIRTKGFRGLIIRTRVCHNPECGRRFETREMLTKAKTFDLPLPMQLAASADVPDFGQ